MFQDIKDFHARFGLEYDGPARRLPVELEGFRLKFMAEEIAEHITSDPQQQKAIVTSFAMRWAATSLTNVPPLEKQMDALIDLIYVALGTAYLQGFDMDEGWRRVHEANMKKVRALRKEDSARGSTYDVVKPPGWTPPDLSDLVQSQHVFIRPEQDEDFAP